MSIKEVITYAVVLPLVALAMHTSMAAVGAPTREACAQRVAHANTQLAVYGQASTYVVAKECY